ncbi:MAG: cyclodeaminase/cyclohydrolase family protein, partial [Thermoleophilaceae bacterium]
MPGLTGQSLQSFLDAVAEAAPAPGGGSSAAVAAALGAALVEMAAGLARDSEAAARASSLRGRCLELAERELSSYRPVLEALRLPREDPARGDRLAAALLEASRAPAEIAQAGAELAELGLSVALTSSPSVRGDAVTGTLLAEAAAAAAARLVEINLAEQPAAEARVRGTRARAPVAEA